MQTVAVAMAAAWLVASGTAQLARASDTGIAVREAAEQAGPQGEEAVVALNHRKIVTFRASLLGHSPLMRAEAANAALATAVERPGPGEATLSAAGEGFRFEVDGETVFFLLPEDLGAATGDSLHSVAAEARRTLQLALRESREARDLTRLAEAAAYSVVASLIAYLVTRLLLRARRSADLRVGAAVHRWTEKRRMGGLATLHAESGLAVFTWVSGALTWLLVFLVLDAWISFVLQQFAYTRPWGESSTAWLLGVLRDFAMAIAGAIPSLLIAVLVFVVARFVSRVNTLFLERVERSNVHLGWLDADTAGPTRRISNALIWLFAVAIAYPYLPGAHSEAFKGLTVMVGLMVSLGASNIVGQALSGLSLMYARALRPGEYVKIGDTEGTVVAVGMFATKVHTGMGEEVSIPNTVIVGNPVQNFSRLVKGGAFVLHTSVTVGYGTPWRQVHALLLEAARRTPGIAEDPPPYVAQTALSDYYVEYRLCAQSNKDAPRRRLDALNQLHANIQDVFNERGVQIMSPHYVADPPSPQVVPPENWYPPPVESPGKAPGGASR